MSLFSEAFSALAGAAQGGQGSLAQEALSLIDNQPGGLSGLLQQFESNGLGSVVQSWVGSGANLPVSGDDIQQVLGSDVVQQVADRLGIDPSEAASGLSQVLPHLVDHLTPGGQVPGDDPLSEGLGALRSKLFG